MYQPMKFVARSSYTKHYTAKSQQGKADAADLRDSMSMRPDMNLSYTTAPCGANTMTTYMRDFHPTPSASGGRRASLSGTVFTEEDTEKVGSSGILRRSRFESITAYQEDFKGDKLPNYSKTKIATLPPNGGIMNVPLEARTSYGAEFQGKRVLPEEPVTGNDPHDLLTRHCSVHGRVSFDDGTTYGGAYDGSKIDGNLVQPDDPSVKSIHEFRSFSTECGTQYRLNGFSVPPKKIHQCTCCVEGKREFCVVHG